MQDVLLQLFESITYAPSSLCFSNKYYEYNYENYDYFIVSKIICSHTSINKIFINKILVVIICWNSIWIIAQKEYIDAKIIIELLSIIIIKIIISKSLLLYS